MAGYLSASDNHGHATPAAGAAIGDVRSVPAVQAVQMLADGNARFAANAPSRQHLDAARLCDTFANGQHPYAAVLSCADSRVPVEHVFDAGIGDLFVVRVAGNVTDVDEIGTLEYGVEHLGINAILVMGHSKCGAVTAVVDGAKVSPNIARLVDNIVPAAHSAKKEFPQLSGPRLVTQVIRANVRRGMADLVNNSDIIRERVKDGSLKIVGGVYDLHTGEVDWLDASSASTPVSASASSPIASSHERLETKSHAKSEPVHSASSKSSPVKASKTSDGHEKVVKSSAEHNHHDEPVAKKSEEHGKKGDGHAEEEASHEEANGEGDAGEKHAAAPGKKDNFYLLAAMLGGSSLISLLISHFMSKRG